MHARGDGLDGRRVPQLRADPLAPGQQRMGVALAEGGQQESALEVDVVGVVGHGAAVGRDDAVDDDELIGVRR